MTEVIDIKTKNKNSLRKEIPPDDLANTAITLQIIEEIRQKVVTGEIKSVFMVGVYSNGGIVTGWGHNGDAIGYYVALGAIEGLKDDFKNSYRKVYEDE